MIDVLAVIQRSHAKGVSLKRCLMELRQKYGGISDEMLTQVKVVYGCSDAELNEITRWFPKLKAGPIALHQLTVCDPCFSHHPTLRKKLLELQHVVGEEVLQIAFGGCLGACGVGPNAMLDGQLYTQLDHNRPFWARLESFIKP